MNKSITTFLIGIIVGSLGMYLSFFPKVIKIKAEQIKMEAFSECVANQISGAGNYEELMFTDVLSCALRIIYLK